MECIVDHMDSGTNLQGKDFLNTFRDPSGERAEGVRNQLDSIQNVITSSELSPQSSAPSQS